MQLEREPGDGESFDVRILNELIKRWIKEAKLQLNSRSTPSVV